MLNHIIIMGRLTRDPELRNTSSGTPVVSFTVAVDRDFSGKDGGEKQTDFIDCTAWRGTAEFISKYFAKGSMIVVAGRLEIRNWIDKEGNKRRNAEVVADSVYFGESRKSQETTYTPATQFPAQAATAAPASYGVPADADFVVIDGDDGQLPF